MECARCGLAPCDLPDDVDPELVFELGEDGDWYCVADLRGATVTIEWST